MLKQHWAEVTARIEPIPGSLIFYLYCPGLATSAAPGQFVMLRVNQSGDPYLRLAFAVHRLMGDNLALYIAPELNTAQLLQIRVGDRLDLLGPAGRPADLGKQDSVALVAQGGSVGPLLSIADRVSGRIVLLTRVASRGQVFPRELVPQNVEYRPFVGAAAEDGWKLALAELPAWAQVTIAASGYGLYRQLVKSFESAIIPLRAGQVYVWMPEKLVCGNGACRTCATVTRHGPRLCCQEGPFMDLAELAL
ncbi:MAG: iron-sulfur cluster-binding protein [Anaerolineae bacterium]